MAEKIKKKILITGGNGFLAGRYLDFFSKRKLDVIVSSRKNLKSKEKKDNVYFYQLKKKRYISIFKKFDNIDYIIHTAGLDKDECDNNKELAKKINVDETNQLAELANKYNVKLFIFISSIHVYSSPLKGVLHEKKTLKNKTIYADLKIKAEKKLEIFSKNKNTKTKFIILRLANGFGKPIDPNSNCWKLFINDVCKQAIINNKIKLNSRGNQTRNFINISELIRITDFLISNKINKKLFKHQIFNIGFNKNYSLIDIANIIKKRLIKLYNIEIKIKYSKKNEGNINFNFKINKIKNLGYIFQNNFIKEIDDLLKFCKKNF